MSDALPLDAPHGMLALVAQHAVIVVDVDGVISHWNAGAVELFGYRAEDTIGQRMDMMIPEHLRKAHWAGFHRAMLDPRDRDMAPICRCAAPTVSCAASLADCSCSATGWALPWARWRSMQPLGRPASDRSNRGMWRVSLASARAGSVVTSRRGCRGVRRHVPRVPQRIRPGRRSPTGAASTAQ